MFPPVSRHPAKLQRLVPRSNHIDPKIAILDHIYEAFNARDADEVLRFMQPQVDWPNGWEGGRLEGQAAVGDYWLRQWKAVNPTVTPRGYEELPYGRILVRVHQRVVDSNEAVLADEMVHHVYTFEGDLVQRMDIETITSPRVS